MNWVKQGTYLVSEEGYTITACKHGRCNDGWLYCATTPIHPVGHRLKMYYEKGGEPIPVVTDLRRKLGYDSLGCWCGPDGLEQAKHLCEQHRLEIAS